MRKLLLSIIAVSAAIAGYAQEASYELPATLSYYGTIVQESGIPFPAANYCTTNPINDGAYIWVPVGSKVMYKNSSTESPTAYKWTVPGADIEDNTAENIIAEYSTAGTYDLPTLTATYDSSEKQFNYDLKIKVGGNAELCHSDTREWGKTYGLGYAPFNPEGNGALGGSNKLDIAGVGNFYRFSSPDMYIDGVNVYTVAQPKNVSSSSAVKIRIYLPYISESNFSMIGQFGTIGALEAENIPMTDCKTAGDGVYVPVKNFGVYNIKIANPMNCEGYPYLFFAVEGFAYSSSEATLEEDFIIATDVMPNRPLDIEDFSNALAHNSFARLSSESDYIRPVSSYGGASIDPITYNYKTYSFWICPVVRGAETPVSGIEDIVTDNPVPELSVSISGNMLTVTGAADGAIEIYSINGSCRATAMAANGGAIFNTTGIGSGVYIVRAANGASAKFIK